MVSYSKTWAAEMELESRVHVLEIIVRKIVEALNVEISDLTIYPEPPDPPSAPEDPSVDGEKLLALREKASLSQERLEELAELEPGSIARAESAEPHREIHASVDTIWKIAEALKISPTLLVKD
jgi:DNA-binding XRE family transcriptional regulator